MNFIKNIKNTKKQQYVYILSLLKNYSELALKKHNNVDILKTHIFQIKKRMDD